MLALLIPLSAHAWYDSDGDGLLDVDEWRAGTNPYRADTDFDGLTDDAEIGQLAAPANTDGDILIDALDDDDDDDGLSTANEYGGTDPAGAADHLNPDSHTISLAIHNIVQGRTFLLSIRGAEPYETVRLYRGTSRGITPPVDFVGDATLGLLNAQEVGFVGTNADGEAEIRHELPQELRGGRFPFQVIRPQYALSRRSNVVRNDFDGS